MTSWYASVGNWTNSSWTYSSLIDATSGSVWVLISFVILQWTDSAEEVSVFETCFCFLCLSRADLDPYDLSHKSHFKL